MPGGFFEKVRSVADGDNGFGGVIVNVAAEFFLESHYQLNGVNTVRTEVVDKAGILDHSVRLDAKMLYHDLFYALAHVTHLYILLLHIHALKAKHKERREP
jgi:hypothetical protein